MKYHFCNAEVGKTVLKDSIEPNTKLIRTKDWGDFKVRKNGRVILNIEGDLVRVTPIQALSKVKEVINKLKEKKMTKLRKQVKTITLSEKKAYAKGYADAYQKCFRNTSGFRNKMALNILVGTKALLQILNPKNIKKNIYEKAI